MKLGTIKLLRTCCSWGAGLLALAAILLKQQLGTARIWVLVAAIVLAVAAVVIASVFYRCPHCGRLLPLGEKNLEACPYCKEKL